jgi:hypothetical protein
MIMPVMACMTIGLSFISWMVTFNANIQWTSGEKIKELVSQE